MDPKRWSRPVTFEEGMRGNYRTITSTGEAARVLSSRWPIAKGREYRRAQQVCVDVLDGKKPPSEARKAFLEAARAARVSVREQ